MHHTLFMVDREGFECLEHPLLAGLLQACLSKAGRVSIGDITQLMLTCKEYSWKSWYWRASYGIYSINQIHLTKSMAIFCLCATHHSLEKLVLWWLTAERNRNNCRLLPPLSQKVYSLLSLTSRSNLLAWHYGNEIYRNKCSIHW